MFRKTISALLGLTMAALLPATALAQSSPFSAYSSFGGSGPDRLTFGINGALSDDSRTVAGFGGPEDIIIGNSFGLLLMATWLAASGSSYSSGPGLLYSFGVEHENNSVDAFRQSGGLVFPTNGDSNFTGVFFGVGFETPFGDSYSSSSIAVPTFGAAFNLGYGWASVDGFGGSFQADGSGIYGRADFYMAIPVAAGILLSPGVSYRAFDFGDVEDGGLSWFLRMTIPL